MPADKQKGKAARKPGNRAQLLQAIDGMPTQGAAAGQPGMPPPAFPLPAHQLDRTAPGVPNLTDLVLRSFQPQQSYATPGWQPPQQPAQQAANATTTPQRGRPMAQSGGGARAQRGMLTPQSGAPR